MCQKPTLSEGQAKLRRWAEERREQQPDGPPASEHVRPRGNGDRDEHDLRRGIERLEATLGR
jgi:hypothetical protein